MSGVQTRATHRNAADVDQRVRLDRLQGVDDLGGSSDIVQGEKKTIYLLKTVSKQPTCDRLQGYF